MIAWDRVLKARKKDRPTAEDYVSAVFDDFMEFHGDRVFFQTIMPLLVVLPN